MSRHVHIMCVSVSALMMYYFTICNIAAGFYSCYRTSICSIGVDTGTVELDMLVLGVMSSVAALPMLWFTHAISGFIQAYFLWVPRVRLTAFILSLVKNKARAEKDHELRVRHTHMHMHMRMDVRMIARP